MTQAELGALVGVDGSSVSSWERGERLPSRDRVYRLYVALNVKDPSLWAASGYLPPAQTGAGQIGAAPQEFPEVEADPTLSVVRKGTDIACSFKPDVIVAMGGGSPMDAAKIMWVLYEHPEVDFEDLALRFMDIRKRIYKFPKLGQKADLVAIPTTSGTGSEVTPFAVVTDDATGMKYPIADYELTPNMAIVDANLVMDMPKSLTAFGGVDAITHALEAYVSVLANEYSDGQALQALKILRDNLVESYEQGHSAPKARENVHNAATIAGIAFANAFLGVCHSMAHKIGAEFHLAHGLANALLIANVVRYNATDNPTKQTAFSQYDRPQARIRYKEIADFLGLGEPGDHTEQKVEALVRWIEDIKAALKIPASIRDAGVNEDEFLAKLDEIAEEAFDDQCTGANPRYPLIAEIKQILLASYYGQPYTEEVDHSAKKAPGKKSGKKKLAKRPDVPPAVAAIARKVG